MYMLDVYLQSRHMQILLVIIFKTTDISLTVSFIPGWATAFWLASVPDGSLQRLLPSSLPLVLSLLVYHPRERILVPACHFVRYCYQQGKEDACGLAFPDCGG
jgi:hypothetical protein